MIDERDQQNQTKHHPSYGEAGLAATQPSRVVIKSKSYAHKTSIVFFGSGPVAAASLELLHQSFNIEAVITKPQPAHHKGDFPVLVLAKKLGLTTLTTANKDQLANLFIATTLKSPVAILIDFGIIIPRKVIDYFPLGIINSHFSILPQWRGADPITFSILSGQKKTGVSTMLLVEALDEGPLLSFGQYDMPADITTPALTKHLVKLSHALLIEAIPKYLNNRKVMPQSVTGLEVSYSRKLTKQDGVIDWHKPAQQLEREIRAFIEWPKSRTALADKEIIVTKAHVVDGFGTPGDILVENKQLLIYCGEQALSIDKLKPAGKSEMSSEAFLAGHWHLL